jgi:hypothetical protein
MADDKKPRSVVSERSARAAADRVAARYHAMKKGGREWQRLAELLDDLTEAESVAQQEESQASEAPQQISLFLRNGRNQ